MQSEWSKSLMRVRRNASYDKGRPLSQGEFADAIGYTASTVSKWERGIRSPDTAMKILLVLLTEDPSFLPVITRIVRQIEKME